MSTSVRRLNQPTPVDVRLDASGRPARIIRERPHDHDRARGRRGGRGAGGTRVPERVEVVLDTWCVDDAWWSDHPVRRIYHEVQLESGVRLVLSWDMLEGRWLAQR